MKLLILLLSIMSILSAAEPVINFNVDNHVLAGKEVLLDASNSNDPDGGDLRYQWKLINSPVGAFSSVNNLGDGTALFNPSRSGIYGFELIVSDDQGEVNKKLFSFSASQTTGQIFYGPVNYDIDLLCKISFGFLGCNEEVYNFNIADPNKEYSVIFNLKKIDNLIVFLNGEQVTFYPDVSGADQEIVLKSVSLQLENEIIIQSSGIFGSEVEFSIQENNLFLTNNLPPTTINVTETAVSGIPKSFALSNATDPNNDNFTFELVENGFSGIASINNGVLTYTSENDFFGSDELIVRAVDNGFPNMQSLFRVRLDVVNTSNNPPIIFMDDLLSFTEDVSGLLNIIDSDPVDITIANQGIGGVASFDPITNFITYIPNDGFTGVDQFEISATDNIPGNPATKLFVNVTVNPNTTPTLNNLSLNLASNSFVEFELIPSTEDATQTIVSLDIEVAPSNGTVQNIGGNLYRYTPNQDYFGIDQVQFKLVDSGRNNNFVINQVDFNVIQGGNQSPVILPSGFQAFKYNDYMPARVYMRLNETPFDPDGDIVEVRWDFGDGNSRSLDTSIGGVSPLGIIYHLYDQAGTYNIKVSVVDNEGAVTTINRDVTFTDTQGPSVRAFADKYEGPSPLTVNFDASLTLSNNSVPKNDLYYIWVFRDGNSVEGVNLTNVSNTYQNDGSYSAYVIVRDGEHSFIKFMNIEVGGSNPTPSPSAIMKTDKLSGVFPLTINFNAEDSIDSNGNSLGLNYDWNFSDIDSGESFSNDKIVSHTFNSPGSYPVFLRVTDSNGITSQQIKIVHVDNPTYKNYQPFFFNVDGLNVSLDLFKNWNLNPVSDSSLIIDFGDGTRVYGNGTSANHTYASEGTYLVTLQAEHADGSLEVSTKQLVLNSSSKNSSFNAVASGFDFQLPATVTASLVGGDYDPSNSTIIWDFGDRIYEGSALLFDTLDHDFIIPGVKSAEPVLTNEFGRSSSAFLTYNVFAETKPKALFKYDKCVGSAPFTFSLDASASSDPDGIKAIQWHAFTNGGEVFSNDLVFTKTINDPQGNIFPSLIIKDNNNDTVAPDANIYVNDGNVPPTNAAPNLIVTSSNNPNNSNQVDFGLFQSTDDEFIVCYQVDLGDGNSFTFYGDFTYEYASPGSYNVTVTAYDNWGATSTESINVNTTFNNYVLARYEKQIKKAIPNRNIRNLEEYEAYREKIHEASLFNSTLINKER